MYFVSKNINYNVFDKRIFINHAIREYHKQLKLVNTIFILTLDHIQY